MEENECRGTKGNEKKGGAIKKRAKRKGKMYDGLYEYKKYRSQEQKGRPTKSEGGTVGFCVCM